MDGEKCAAFRGQHGQHGQDGTKSKAIDIHPQLLPRSVLLGGSDWTYVEIRKATLLADAQDRLACLPRESSK